MSSASPPAISQPMPRAPGPPLVGSLVPMVRDPVRFLVDSYRECGPVFRLNVLGRRFVVLAGVDANQFVTRNERDPSVAQSYLASEQGKVYTMLAHASGRLR